MQWSSCLGFDLRGFSELPLEEGAASPKLPGVLAISPALDHWFAGPHFPEPITSLTGRNAHSTGQGALAWSLVPVLVMTAAGSVPLGLSALKFLSFHWGNQTGRGHSQVRGHEDSGKAGGISLWLVLPSQ